jgi:hypothetical protein
VDGLRLIMRLGTTRGVVVAALAAGLVLGVAAISALLL